MTQCIYEGSHEPRAVNLVIVTAGEQLAMRGGEETKPLLRLIDVLVFVGKYCVEPSRPSVQIVAVYLHSSH